jgi:hypothetical protein
MVYRISRSTALTYHNGSFQMAILDRTPTALGAAQSTDYELRYASLFNAGRGFAFPCDAQGHVCLDALSERTRNNYLFARALVGREYACPVVAARLH